jgi:hypothetical protein
VARAQEEPEPPTWLNVSWISFVANGGTDRTNAPILYLLFADKTFKENEEFFGQVNTLLDEMAQEDINQAVPESIQLLEESINQMRETIKEHPEFEAQYKEAIKEFERQKKEAMDQYVKPSKSYSYDPATILNKLKAIAVNRKFYSGYWEAGNGLYCVTEVPRYCSLKENDRYSHTKITFDEKDRYKWGFIDENGRQVLPYQYSWVNANALFPDAFPDQDLIFIYKQDPDGSVHAGALNYRGQVRIPFIYDDLLDVFHGEDVLAFSKNGKKGLVNINTGKEALPFEYTTFSRIAGGWLVSKDDINYGMVSVKTAQVIIPLKYRDLWSDRDPSFLRFDGKIDYYDEDGHLLRTENQPEE